MIKQSVHKQISGLAAASARRLTTAARPTSGGGGGGGGGGLPLRLLYTKPRWPRALAATQLTCRRNLANTTSNTQAPQAAYLKKQPAASVYEDASEHLPPLPVPNLNGTLERLKETIWPIAMNSNEFAQALQLIEQFAGSPGQKLDLLLRAKASQTKNWLSHDWWLQEAYLKSRKSLVINSNPALIYPQLPFEVRDRPKLVATCAQLISSIIDCKLSLQRGWNPEQASANSQQGLDSTLCYDQYRRIFGSTRLPGEHVDSFRPHEPREDELSFNLVCSFRGRFYEIKLDDVSSEQGRVEALERVLGKIVSCQNQNEQENNGPGVLTTMNRDLWAQSIKSIDPDSLEAITKAHLVFCLDTLPSEPEDAFARHLVSGDATTSTSSSSSESYLGALARQVLHSDRSNVGNRWFDKSLQLIVVSDSACSQFLGAGINYEHCIGEAVVLTRLIEFSHAKLIEQQRARSPITSGSSASDSVATFRQLKMANESSGADHLSEQMQRARQDFVSQIEQFDLNYFRYQNYGRDSIKQWRFSPDTWFQLALQLAHYQLHKRLGPCYESASTRRFAFGRTETIRSLTKDVAQFCFEPNYENLLAAADSHKNYAVAANQGAAIDRVLLGYRMIFNELKANQWAWGLPTFASKEEASAGSRGQLKFNSLADTQREQQVDLHDLFTEKELNILGAFFNNELFERAKRFSLSTSQVSSLEHPSICTSYGPIVADGYACCYNLSQQQMVASVTANSSNQSFSCEAGKFSESLRDSLDRMRDIVSEGRHEQGLEADQHQHELQQQQKQRS